MRINMIFMLKVIGAVVSGGALPQPPFDINWNQIYTVAKFHNVTNIVAYAVSIANYPMENDIKQKFLKSMYDSVLVDENQKKEFGVIFKKFEENSIDYMPLKGINLKRIYASPDMRNMSDGDILIRECDKEKIDGLMNELGYNFKTESNHELVYIKPPFINIELHKMLIPSYNDDLYKYYGDGWKLAERVEGSCRFALKAEDEFIYVLTHFAKHYRDGGAGIKYIADIWLYMKKNSLNLEYVLDELKKLGLYDFGNNVIALTKVWFENGEFDGLVLDMTKYILNSGQFGNSQNIAIVNEMRENSQKDIEQLKKNKWIRLIFPGMVHMKRNYPVLERYPCFIVFCWIWRLIRVVIGKTDRRVMNKIDYLSKENLTEFDMHMQNVGLDIYNGRKK